MYEVTIKKSVSPREVGSDLPGGFRGLESLRAVALVNDLFIQNHHIEFAIPLGQPHRLDIAKGVETAGQLHEPVLKTVSEVRAELPFEFVPLVCKKG